MSGTQGTFTAGTGTVNFNAAGAQTVAPFAYTFNNLTLSGSGVKTTTNATVNGVLTMEGTATASVAPTYGAASTLKYNPSTSRTSGAEWVTPFAGTGGVVIANTGVITLNGAKVFNANAPLTINSGATLATANYQLTFGGNFVNGGTFTAGSSPIVITGTVAQSIAGYTTSGLTTMSKTGGVATYTGNVSGGALTINGTGGTLNLGAGLTHTFTGTLTRTDGTLDCGSSTVNFAGSVSGTTGSWTAGTSIVNFTGAGAQTIPGVSYYDLGFSGAGAKTIDAATTVTVGRNWAVGSPVTMTTTANATITGNITGTGAITAGSGTITIGGDWINNGTFTKGTGTVIYNGASGQTLGALSYYNLTTIGAGTKTAAGAVSVSNTFTNSSTVDMAGYALTLGSSTVNTSGTVRFSGAANGLAIASGTVDYYGTSQTVGTGTYNNLTINQASGAATLGGAVTVNGVLTMTNGLVTTGANTLTLGASGSISDAGSFKYINGNLAKHFASGGLSFTFAIGDASNYTPVAVAYADISTGGILTASTTPGQHGNISTSGINSGKDVNRYWTLSNSGIISSGYSATFTFTPTDLIGSPDPNGFVIRKYASGWITTSIGSRTSTTAQATSLTSYGDFAIGNQLLDHYAVSVPSPQAAGSVFTTTVTGLDILEQIVADDNSTVVTMTSSTGNAQFDGNGDGTFGDATKSLTNGTFSINTKDDVVETVNILASDGNGKTGTSNSLVIHVTAITISGNAGVAGAVLSYTDGTPKTSTADGSGGYSFTVPYSWSGTVTPALTGYTFSPVNRSYTSILVDQTAQNYTATPFVTVNLKIFLAGPFSGSVMTTALNSAGLLPLSSNTAYNATTYSYTPKTVTSIPNANIVDWVLVELRTLPAGTSTVSTQAAFLKNDGTVVDIDGASALTVNNIAANGYYVVVRHRNHLPVMSTTTIPLNASSALYDFTTGIDKSYGTNGMVELSGGLFGMWAGDINRNGTVKFTGSQNDDAALISVVGLNSLTSIVPGYLDADLNLDGNAKYTEASNDHAVIIGTVGITRLTRIIASQVPN